MFSFDHLKTSQILIQIGPEHEVEYATTLHSDGLETSSLSMRFRILKKHFKHDGGESLKLKCTASISDVYMMSNEAQLVIYNLDERERKQRQQQMISSSSSGGSMLQKISENLSQGLYQSITCLPSLTLILLTLKTCHGVT